MNSEGKLDIGNARRETRNPKPETRNRVLKIILRLSVFLVIFVLLFSGSGHTRQKSPDRVLTDEWKVMSQTHDSSVGTNHSALSTQHSVLGTHDSALSTQHSKTEYVGGELLVKYRADAPQAA